MPSSDYMNAVGGGLKLKGAKDAGVKKNKRKKAKAEASGSSKPAETEEEPQGEIMTALQKALADEEVEGAREVADELVKADKDKGSGAGKTEAQRKHGEIRRKRVGDLSICSG